MKCEICGAQKAVIHVQQVIGKERMDLHLCEECAMERGIGLGSGEGDHLELSISSMLSGLVDVPNSKRKRSVCPQCGMTWETIRKREKIGCAECYSIFSEEIHFLLEKMGLRTVHRGKLPKRLSAYKRFFIDAAKLKEGLEEALKREDYEKAARIRDRIRDLEKSSEGQ